MEAVTGVFATCAAAESALQKVHSAGVPLDKLTLLTPGSADQIAKEAETVPVEAAEQPGMGAVRGVVEIAVAVHKEQKHVSVSQVGAGRNPFSAEDAVLVAER